MRFFLFIFISSCISTCFATTWQLSADGIGPIKIGMTLPQAAKAAHQTFSSTKPDTSMGESVSCFTTNFKAKDLDGLSFMVIYGKIMRVNVTSDKFTTTRGITLGDSEEKVKQQYPSIQTETHHYVSDGHYLTFIQKPNRAIRFETDGKKVTQMYAGRKTEVNYVEECL